MLILLHGEDNFLVGRRKQALVKAFQKKYSRGEVFVFDFEGEGGVDGVGRALAACADGLFSVEKMVIFFHSFSLEEKAEKMLVTFLAEQGRRTDEKLLLLFVESGKIKKSTPLAKALFSALNKEEEVASTKDQGLALVKKELALLENELTFEPQALKLFLAATGSDAARIVSELEKLTTFKEAGKITISDVELLLERPQEQVIFQALDALGRGEKKRALLLFHQEGQKSGGVFPLLSLCAWQVRQMLIVREAFDRGIRRSPDVVVATSLSPYVVQKALAVIEYFPLARLKRGLSLLSDIDTALKQGKADPFVSLVLFVWKF